ncbi:MAG: DUF4249 family protein [Bacteroidales bacterium]|nr:DUF4249 family protein [Bacteroidales bacterium]
MGKSEALLFNNSGYYYHPGISGEENKSYKLRVETIEGNIYESNLQAMTKPYNQDSIYAEFATESELVSSTSGNYSKVEQSGIETFVDLASGSTDLPKCRFNVRVTVLYTYFLPGFPPPTVYCWKTFSPNTDINITSSKFDKTVGVVKKHSIGFFGTSIHLYDEEPDRFLLGWLLSIDKYNMSNETHQYYLNIKKQLEASGKIFDPTPSQILGNLKCINNPEKLAFGFFEVSYIQKLYYRYSLVKGVRLIEKDGFPGLTGEGELINQTPEFWYK